MYIENLGEGIKDLRKEKQLSQKEVSDGICTQAYLSKIESELVIPSFFIIYSLSLRLGTDISYFLDIVETERPEYRKSVFEELRLLKKNRDYQAIKEIVSLEKKNPLFKKDKKGSQFLKWHEAISVYFLEKDFSRAIKIIDEALKYSDTVHTSFSERDIEILISKANIYMDEKLYDDAISIFKKGEECLKQLHSILDQKIPIRLYYNLARALRLNKEYEESISYCDTGIRLCIRSDIMYALGDLCFQKALDYIHLNDKEHAKLSLKDAESVYLLKENKKMISVVREKYQLLLD